jgi:hypothetical protein
MPNPIPQIGHLYFFLIVKDQQPSAVKTASQTFPLG